MGTENTFLFEAFDLLSCTTIAGVLYGITFTLYCMCAWTLYLTLQKPDKRRQAMLSLGYISLLFLCATGILVVNGRLIQEAYINHADFPGGPLEYERSYNPTMNSYFTTGSTLNFVASVLTMAIQIRRLWIIWSGTRYAITVAILPVLLIFSYIALDIPVDIVVSFMPLDQLGISLGTEITLIAAEFAISSGFALLVTSLIATRLLLARRQHMKIMGMSEAASPYLSITVMLVESYALGSAWSLAGAISYAIGSPSEYLFATGDVMIQIIAYFLIIYRVANEKGWTKQTEEKLATLQWNHGTRTATDELSSIRSRVPAVGVDSLPVIHSDSVA